MLTFISFHFFFFIFHSLNYPWHVSIIFSVVLLDTTQESSLDWTRLPYGPQARTPGVSLIFFFFFVEINIRMCNFFFVILFIYWFSGLKRALQISNKASIGVHMLYAMLLIIMLIIGYGRHLLKDIMQIESILKSNSVCVIAIYFQVYKFLFN